METKLQRAKNYLYHIFTDEPRSDYSEILPEDRIKEEIQQCELVINTLLQELVNETGINNIDLVFKQGEGLKSYANPSGIRFSVRIKAAKIVEYN